MSETPSSKPTCRWGIISTGMISSWFVQDLMLTRPDARATHTIHSIGSSSLSKGQKFVDEHLSSTSPRPRIYGSYDQVLHDPDVDVVYIGLPHGMHKEICLQAIEAGKPILCEKAFTINAREAREVLDAAASKGIYVMEAMWLRFTPLVKSLLKHLHQDRIIGDVRRTFSDFGLDKDFSSLDAGSRYKDITLGAGSLLDIGIYSLTWGLVTLDPGTGEKAVEFKVLATMSVSDGVDAAASVLLFYPQNGRQGILTSTMEFKNDTRFCRIEGTKGFIIVEGPGPSMPRKYTVYAKSKRVGLEPEVVQVCDFPQPGKGFYYEADAVALDLANGKTENEIMPHSETIRVMELMDEIRRQGGLKYPQDNQ